MGVLCVPEGFPVATTDVARLALYQQAEEEILTSGQSIAINGRNMSRGNLAEIRKMIDVLSARVARASRGPLVLGRPQSP